MILMLDVIRRPCTDKWRLEHLCRLKSTRRVCRNKVAYQLQRSVRSKPIQQQVDPVRLRIESVLANYRGEQEEQQQQQEQQEEQEEDKFYHANIPRQKSGK
jgi:hypothetical protein